MNRCAGNLAASSVMSARSGQITTNGIGGLHNNPFNCDSDPASTMTDRTLTFPASAVFDLLGMSGSGVRIHDRPSKFQARLHTPSQNGKRILPSAELRRAQRLPEEWPPDALQGKLVAGKSPHVQRRRSLRG